MGLPPSPDTDLLVYQGHTLLLPFIQGIVLTFWRLSCSLATVGSLDGARYSPPWLTVILCVAIYPHISLLRHVVDLTGPPSRLKTPIYAQ